MKYEIDKKLYEISLEIGNYCDEKLNDLVGKENETLYDKVVINGLHLVNEIMWKFDNWFCEKYL